ncbi:hypothetical protein FHG87_018945 [Trinorchestia longiramus]|nr:hypothetical protein FHG87_018945 [Trinorchestia longiramus]
MRWKIWFLGNRNAAVVCVSQLLARDLMHHEATVVEWSAACVWYQVSASGRQTAGSIPGNEYELFLVSRHELALIGKPSTHIPPMDTSQYRRMELTIILTLRMLTLRI